MKTRGKGVWGSSDGWKVLGVEDGLLLGAEEGGFAGLEVLEDVTLLDAGVLGLLGAVLHTACCGTATMLQQL